MSESWASSAFHDVDFGVAKSRRYHAYMREFYRRCHDFALTISVVSGSAAFVALLPSDPNAWVARVLTGLVAVATTLDLILDFSKKADLHDKLCRRFTELSARMVEHGVSEKSYKQACAERLRIEADEPTERRLVEMWAYNDECRSRGSDLSSMIPLTRLQSSPVAYLFRIFGERGIEQRLNRRRQQRGSYD